MFVGGTPGSLFTLSRGILSREEHLHPGNFLVVGEFEDEFIDDPINTNRSAYQIQFGICRVIEDEVMSVKVRKLLTANSTSQLQPPSELLPSLSSKGLTVGI